MSDKIEYSKPVPPFVRFCAANIPMVFDDSLSYYEALCALWKWLQTDVIDVINNNARVTQLWREELTTFENDVTHEIEEFEADMRADFKDLSDLFDQLHDYVENYFDNLDVQEEINNKLDEMADDGTLQEIITTYIQSNVAWAFDSVAEMLSATNLIAGSYAQTFGFYAVGDGGAARYYIRNKEEDETADDIFTFAIGDSLIAEYTYEGSYRTKQLGVKADGSADMSSKLQSIIAKIDAINLAGTDSYTPLTFDSGIYRVDSQIELSVNVPLKADGLVTIQSYVDNASCLWIKPKADDPSDWFSRTEEYISGDGFLIEYAGENSGYGLEIGATSDLGYYKGFMHSKIENVTLKDFAIGILFNPIHIFCNSFERIQFNNCAVQVQWGKSGLSLVDSGERIVFTECQFGGNHAQVFKMYSAMGSMYINNSSMDYCDCIFNDMTGTGYTNVFIDNSHIEGVAHNMTPEEMSTTPYGIINGDFPYSMFVFSNTHIGVTKRVYLFKYGTGATGIANKYNVCFNDCFLGTPNTSNDPAELFIAHPDVNVKINGIVSSILGRTQGITRKQNLVDYGLFENETDGTKSVSTNTVVGASTITYMRSLDSSATIYSNASTGGKGIRFMATASDPAIQIKTHQFDVKGGEILNMFVAFTNLSSTQLNADFYDVNGTKISTFTKTPETTGTPSSNTTFIPTSVARTVVPENAVKCDIRLVSSISGRTFQSGDTFAIDGFYCFKS